MKKQLILLIIIIILSPFLYSGIPDTYPIKTKFEITHYYGEQINDFTGKLYKNEVINIGLHRETTIYPTASGIVERIQHSKIDNTFSIKINHGNEFKSEYKGLDKVYVEINDTVSLDIEIGAIAYDLSNIYGRKMSYAVYYKRRLVNPEILILYNKKDLVVDFNSFEALTRELTTEENNFLNTSRKRNINNEELKLSNDFLVSRNWGPSFWGGEGVYLTFYNNGTYRMHHIGLGYHCWLGSYKIEDILGTYSVQGNVLVLTPVITDTRVSFIETIYEKTQQYKLTKNNDSFHSLIELKSIKYDTSFADMHSPPDYLSIKEIHDTDVYALPRLTTELLNETTVYVTSKQKSDKSNFSVRGILISDSKENHVILPEARTVQKYTINGVTDSFYWCDLKMNEDKEISTVRFPYGWIFGGDLNENYKTKIEKIRISE